MKKGINNPGFKALPSSVQENILSNMKYGGKKYQYAAGGAMPMEQLTEFKEGGKHDENPLGGIPQGINPEGQMNLVEEGETKFDAQNYIFSDTLKVDKETAEEFNLSPKMAGKTFADASKLAGRKKSKREGDVIEEAANNRDLTNLMNAQEGFKENQVAEKMAEIDELDPNAIPNLLSQGAPNMGGQMQEAPMDEQAMMEQQMMAQQGQPSPEEMAMMQQQQDIMMGQQEGMMMNGGSLYNYMYGGNIDYGYGGNMRYPFGGNLMQSGQEAGLNPMQGLSQFFNMGGILGGGLAQQNLNLNQGLASQMRNGGSMYPSMYPYGGSMNKMATGGEIVAGIGSGLYGLGEGLLDTLTFGLTDELTDRGYEALQEIGPMKGEDNIGDSIRGGANIAGAATGAVLTGGATTGSAVAQGSKGAGDLLGAVGEETGNETLGKIGQGVEGAGQIAGMIVGGGGAGSAAGSTVGAGAGTLGAGATAASAADAATKASKAAKFAKVGEIASNKAVQAGTNMATAAIGSAEEKAEAERLAEEERIRREREMMMTNDPNSPYYNPIMGLPEVEMSEYGGRIYKSGGKSTVNKAGNYTQPGMRKNLFNRIKTGSKGGPAGKWSARKAQMLAKQYKAKGGGYREMGGPIETNEMKAGGLAASQQSLKKWTSQEWDNVSGKKGDRYLPKNVINSMSPQEKAAENRKKKEAGSGNAAYSKELASKVRNAENGGPLDFPNNENMTAFMNMNTPMVDPSMQPNNINVDPSIAGFNYNVLSPSSTAPMIRPSYDIDRLPVQPTGFLPTDNLRMINVPTPDVDVSLEKDTTYGSDMSDAFPDLEIKETPLQAALKFAAPAYNIGMGLFSKPEDYSPDYVPVEFTKLDSSQALKNAKEHVAGIRSALTKVSRNPQNLQNLALTGARIASDIQQKYDQVNATIENKAEELNKKELRNLNRIKKNLEMQQDKVKTDFIQQGIKQLGDISKAEQANQMAVLYSKLGSPDMAKNFSYTPFGQNLFKALNKKNKEE